MQGSLSAEALAKEEELSFRVRMVSRTLVIEPDVFGLFVFGLFQRGSNALIGCLLRQSNEQPTRRGCCLACETPRRDRSSVLTTRPFSPRPQSGCNSPTHTPRLKSDRT